MIWNEWNISSMEMEGRIKPVIRAMKSEDSDTVLEILREGIKTGHSTFESESPDWTVWDEEHLPQPRLVAEVEGNPAGWVALSAVSGRCFYGGISTAGWRR